MFAKLIKPKPLLEDETIEWLFDGFAWALKNFGSDVFYNETQLIEPSNKCFPGKGDSIDDMAALILKQVKQHAGLEYWPTRVVDHHVFADTDQPSVNIQQALQQTGDGVPTHLTVLYEPQQVANPNAMIANYTHALAHHLAFLAHDKAPCDKEQWPHMMELLGVYMGFGIMFINTAVPERITCGSCHNPATDRKGALTEMQVIYAMAIFCALKDIPAKEVSPHIKSYLRPLLKKAIKDVQGRTDMLAGLKAIDAPSRVRGRELSQQWQLKLASETG